MSLVGAEIDRLEIGIEAQARNANRQLDNLISKLERVSNALGGAKMSGLASFANGISKIAGASTQLGNVKTADFTRLAKNLERISKVDQSALNRTSASLVAMSQSLGKISGASQSAVQISEIAKNIAKLGNKSVQSAISNMPRLASELSNMMSTLSKAPTVSNNIIQMTNALARLAAQGSKVGTALNAAGTKGTKATSGLSGWLERLTASTGKATKATRSFAQIAGSFYSNFFVVMRGLRKAWNATEASMDFLETVNYFEVAMRKLGDDAASNWQQAGYDSAESYAKSFSERAKQLTAKMTGYNVDEDGNATYTGQKNLGMNPDTVMNYQAMFAQVSESIGVAEESALNFSTALTMLGTDWASLRNTTFEQAFEKFASALAGQSRAVRAFGIDITNATLQEYAYKYGLTDAISEMNQATKAQLRLLAILDQSKVAYGDLANTMESPSNQLRMLRQNFSNLARTIGNLFLPVVEKVLPYINGMVMALQRLFSWVGGLLGIKFNSINSSIGGMDNGIEDLVGGADDAEGALNGANDAAKKLKNTVLGFDELNQLNDPTSGSGSGSGSGGIGGGNPLLDEEIAKALADYQKAWDEAFDRMDNKAQQIADRICKAFKRGDYEGIGRYISNGITKGLESIDWNKVYSVSKNFGKGFAEFLNGLISPKLFSAVGKTIAGALNTAIYNALAFGETFNFKNLGESIAAGMNSFFSNYDFKALAQTFNVWAKGILDTIITALDDTDWEMIGKQIGSLLDELDFMEVGAKVGKAVWKAINAGIDVFKEMFDAAPIETTIVSLLGFNKAWKVIFGTNAISGMKKVITKFSAFKSIVTITSKALTGNKNAAIALQILYPKLGSKVSGIIAKFTTFKNLFKGNFFGNLKSEISNIQSKMTGLQKGVVGTVAVFAEFSLVKSGFKDIASGADNVVTSIGKIVAGAGAAAAALKLIGLSNHWTAAITGVVGLVGAVKGLSDAFGEIRAEKIGNDIYNALTSPGGVPVETISDNFKSAMQSISDGFSTVNEKSQELDTSQKNIQDIWLEIEHVQESLKAGVITTEEATTQLTSLFGSLAKAAQSKFGALEETLIAAFGENGALKDAYSSIGVDTSTVIGNALQLNEQATKRMTELAEQMAGLDPTSEKYQELEQEFASITAGVDKFSVALDDYNYKIDTIKGVDISTFIKKDGSLDTEEFNTYLSGITTAMTDADTSIEEAGNGIRQTLQEELNTAVAMNDFPKQQEIQATLDALPNAIDYLKTQVHSSGQAVVDEIQMEFVNKTEDVIKNAYNEGDSDYVKEAADNFGNNVLNPLSEQIEKSFKNFGVNGAGWAEDAGKQIVDSVFTTVSDPTIGANGILAMKDNWEKSLTSALDEVTEKVNSKEYGKNLVLGYKSGIQENMDTVFDTVESWMDELDQKIHDSKMKYGSPSKRTKDYGKWTVDGFNNGITDNKDSTATAISDWMTDVKSALETQWNSLKTWWEGLKLDFPKITMPHFKIAGEFDLKTGDVPSVSVNYYANGGFPTSGQLFMARENGINEMVGQIGNRHAVANNDQIVESIQSGVEAAMMNVMMAFAGQSDNGKSEPVIENIVKVDSETLYRMTQKGKEKHDSRYHVVTEI